MDAGVAIKTMRMAFGKTCFELCQAIGETKEWLQEVENGVREISAEKFKSICSFFGMTPDEVLEIESKSKEGH